MPDPSLRGKCREYAEAVCAEDPSLRLVRGWYHDPMWGRQEHWWTVRPDGEIHDPTAAQFPMGGIDFLYEEFAGFFQCRNCGSEVAEVDLVQGCCCSAECFGEMVGVPVGSRPGPSQP